MLDQAIIDLGDDSSNDANKIKAYKQSKDDIINNQIIEQREKFMIAHNILTTCKSEPQLYLRVDNTDYMGRLEQWAYFTKLPKEYLEQIHVVERERSVVKAIKETKPLPINVKHFIYSDIRDIFIEYYLGKKQMLTNIAFLETLAIKRDLLYYKKMAIRTLVKNKLVDYHFAPSLSRNILTENPAFACQRNIYLRQMIKLRSSGRQFIYITIKRIENRKDRRASYLALAVSPFIGLVGKCDAIDNHDEGIIHQIRQWLHCHILRQIPEGAVVVLTQPRKTDFCEPLLTPSSSKAEMMKWLEERDVPFDTEDHKGTLYNLVKINKKKYKDKGFYEDIFLNSGFEVAISPIEYERLDFFESFYDKMRKLVVYDTKTVFKKIFSDINSKKRQDWMRMEEMIVVEERQMMREDNEMVVLVENILHMVKNGVVTVEDFPISWPVTKADNFETHIGDIIVD